MSPRYADLLSPLSPAGAPVSPPPMRASGINGSTYDEPPPAESNPVAVRVPASAPPYPYEGDLEDAARLPVPVERPTPPIERDALTQAPMPLPREGARHGADDATPAGGVPLTRRQTPTTPTPPPSPGYDVPPGFQPQSYDRPMYDTSIYERPQAVAPPPPPPLPPPAPPPPPVRSATWAQEWPQPERAPEPPRPEPGFVPPSPLPAQQAPAPPSPSPAPRPPEPVADVLPQRVPAEPDVPTVPEPPTTEPPADGPDLTRIWSHLRRDDVQPRERPEGFDVKAILAAVRGVEGVRDASLRTTNAGAHSLRLDLADGADPADVSRIVARLLQDRMGLAAAPTSPEPSRPVTARAEVPAQPRQPASAFSALRAASTGEEERSPGTARAERTPVPAEAPRRRARRAQEESESTPYPMGQSSPAEPAPPRPLNPGARPGPRVVIDEVQVSTFGLDATVEVRLAADERRATGRSNGPAVDAYVLRLCATAAASAVDDLLSTAEQVGDRGKCFVEHAAVVPFGSCEVAVAVVLLVCGGWVEQLAGSALVAGDPRQAVVRATLNAVNRRLEALLA
ncbi:hypothetical protein GCM10023263_24810 [Phytohabitans rumicis]